MNLQLCKFLAGSGLINIGIEYIASSGLRQDLSGGRMNFQRQTRKIQSIGVTCDT